ncbi:MAG TPA: hypothetical protein VNG33_06390, partial [Polyangiaceae bacterium]|nr:hypothetical protein [Polyangiaceae bacterium]
MKARFSLIAALAVTLAPLEALAQAWVSNPDFSEGIGIRSGNVEFHPSVGAEAGYDSNYTRASKAEGPVDVYKFRLTPSFTLSTLNAKRLGGAQGDVAFTAGAYLSYFELIPADSANSEIQRRNFTTGVDTRLTVFPQRKVGFDLLGSYVRAIDADG